MSQVLSLMPSDMDINNLYSDLAFPPGRDGRPYVVFNMVSSVDGRVTIKGRSQLVGSGTDHYLMRRIRAAADMVLVGAGTLRAENINFNLPLDLQELRASHGLPRTPLAAVLSPSAELPLNRTFFTSKEFSSIVLTTKKARPETVRELERHAQVVLVGEADVDLSYLMSLLADRFGVKRLVVEGGPSLNASMIQAGYADELFWTIAPKVIGGRELTMTQTPDIFSEAGRPLRLASAHSFGSELYLRYLF